MYRYWLGHLFQESDDQKTGAIKHDGSSSDALTAISFSGKRNI